MAINSQWSTIEGGITQTFPLSINRTAYWTALRRGECFYQDMTDRNRNGILSFQGDPKPSPNYFTKQFVETVTDTSSQVDAVFFYGRWWKVAVNFKTRLYYSDLGRPTADFSNGKYIDFVEDSINPIQLIATDGDGRIFVIKSTCGYTLDNANQDPGIWRKSAPEYSIGTVHEGPSFTNAILNGALMLVWNGAGEHGNRHYQWNGRGAGVELSEDIRELTEGDKLTSLAAINWSQQLVLIGATCYDMNARRIFNYSGATTASYTSRPFYDPMYRMQTVHRLAFITNGKEGSFDAQIEYGQSADNLQKSKIFKVQIRPSTANRFRHIWTLDIPVLCRVWRVSIKNLVGCGISQIDADVSLNDSPDFEEAL